MFGTAAQKEMVETAWKILIIDDDEDDFLIARDMLKEARGRRFDIHWASTYSAGREMLLSNEYNAVLVDYDLGLHSGIELIREANARGNPAPLILLTGRGNYEVDVEAMQAGATLYLTKGEVNSLLLERSIRYAIERKQIESQLQASNDRLSSELAERQRVEETLRENESRLRESERVGKEMTDVMERLIQAAPIGIAFLRGPKHVYTLVNQEYLTYARGKGDLIGRTVAEKWPEIAETVVPQMDRVYHTGEPFSVTNAPLTVVQNGVPRDRFFNYSFTPIYQADGSIDGVMILAVDTTEAVRDRQAAEEQTGRLETVLQALRVSEERFFKAFNANPNAQVISQVSDGTIEIINDGFERLFGYRQEEVRGRTSRDLNMFAHPEDRDEAIRRLRSEGNLRDYDIEIRIRSSEIRQALLSVETINVNGDMLMLTVIQDITERKRAEQALRESERILLEANDHFRQLADAMPQLVWTARADGSVDYYNQRYKEYAGIAPVDGKRWEWGPVLHPDDVQATVAAWNHAVATGEIYQIEHRVRMADGTYCWHLSRGVPAKDERGAIARWYGTATNIQSQKEIEEKLRHSNQELEQFAFVASHDLQEPLRKIIMFGSSLRRQLAEDPQNIDLEYLDRMQNAAERMQNMVQGLLELSRVNTRGREFAPVALNEIVDEVLSDLEARIQAAGGQVRVEALPTIDADALQMRQLFQNLIGNAIKFHKPGVPPVVRISAEVSADRQPRMMRIRIEDNGIGFEQRYAERIFQPFQRLHGRAEYEGSGLGLAICQKILERHHWTIEVHSAPGQGSVFTILLPAQAAEKAINE